jgi:hypothetical protein
MIIRTLLVLFTCGLCSADIVAGQTVESKTLHGTYIMSTGAPKKTSQINDSTIISIPPATYTKSVIMLKRFGSVRKTYNNYYVGGLDSDHKGRWKMDGDTLTIQLQKVAEQYLVEQLDDGGIILKSLSEDNAMFGKQE